MSCSANQCNLRSVCLHHETVGLCQSCPYRVTKQSSQVPLTVCCHDGSDVFRIDSRSYRMANVVFLAVWLACEQLVANPVYIYSMPMWAGLSSHPVQNSVNHQGMGCGLLWSMFSPGWSGHSSLMYTLMSTCLQRLTQHNVDAFTVSL